MRILLWNPKIEGSPTAEEWDASLCEIDGKHISNWDQWSFGGHKSVEQGDTLLLVTVGDPKTRGVLGIAKAGEIFCEADFKPESKQNISYVECEYIEVVDFESRLPISELSNLGLGKWPTFMRSGSRIPVEWEAPLLSAWGEHFKAVWS
jgi:hypothetical protein